MHSEAILLTARPTILPGLTARPRHIYDMRTTHNPYEITSEPILKGKAPSPSGYTLRVVAMWFIFTLLLFV